MTTNFLIALIETGEHKTKPSRTSSTGLRGNAGQPGSLHNEVDQKAIFRLKLSLSQYTLTIKIILKYLIQTE